MSASRLCPASRTGTTSGANIIGIDEFRRALRDLDANWGATLIIAHQKIGSKGARWARSTARGMGGVQARAASAIGERHSERSASIGTFPSFHDRMGNVAFWGSKRHTGWYARARYNDSPPQHPAWVGNSWDVATATGGPYAINPALHAHLNDLVDEYADMLDDIAHKTFPNR